MQAKMAVNSIMNLTEMLFQNNYNRILWYLEATWLLYVNQNRYHAHMYVASYSCTQVVPIAYTIFGSFQFESHVHLANQYSTTAKKILNLIADIR